MVTRKERRVSLLNSPEAVAAIAIFVIGLAASGIWDASSKSHDIDDIKTAIVDQKIAFKEEEAKISARIDLFVGRPEIEKKWAQQDARQDAMDKRIDENERSVLDAISKIGDRLLVIETKQNFQTQLLQSGGSKQAHPSP